MKSVALKTRNREGLPVIWYATTFSAGGVSLIATPEDIGEPYRVHVRIHDVCEVHCFWKVEEAADHARRSHVRTFQHSVNGKIQTLQIVGKRILNADYTPFAA